MPYIKDEARQRLFSGAAPQTAGELNFMVSVIIDQYWHENGKDYQAFNDILGALSGVSFEYYRRKIAYYETSKMFENGDVYREEKTPIAGEGSADDAPSEPLRSGPVGQEIPSKGREL